MKRHRTDRARVLGVICAGGDGTRIEPLSRYRAKPAIPIGATHRLVDIPLSNNLNSGIAHNYVIVQKSPHSLTAHLEGYSNGVAQMRGQFIRTLSPPKEEERFFMSDADSLIQLRIRLVTEKFNVVLITMADQVVKIDYRQVIEYLFDQDADAVMVFKAVPVETAKGALGVMEIGTDRVVTAMAEKPQEPKEIPGQPGFCYANLAMYAIRMETFSDMLDFIQNHHEPESPLSHSGIPWLIENRKVVAFGLEWNSVAGVSERERTYFADTATVDAWFEAQMQMCGRDPVFNFYSQEWPIFTSPRWPISPAKIDDAEKISEVLFGWGAICEDKVTIVKSVISNNTLIKNKTKITNSVILDSAEIGPNCVLDHVVIEKNIKVPVGTVLTPKNPPDPTVIFGELYTKIKAGEQVRENVPVLTERGILVFPRNYRF